MDTTWVADIAVRARTRASPARPRCATLSTSRSLLTTGTRCVRWACWDAMQMASTSNADFAISCPSTAYSALSQRDQRTRTASVGFHRERLRLTSGIPSASGACSAVRLQWIYWMCAACLLSRNLNSGQRICRSSVTILCVQRVWHLLKASPNPGHKPCKTKLEHLRVSSPVAVLLPPKWTHGVDKKGTFNVRSPTWRPWRYPNRPQKAPPQTGRLKRPLAADPQKT